MESVLRAMSSNSKKVVSLPKARNKSAHVNLETYFQRISDSLGGQTHTFMYLNKYARINEEAQKLLSLEGAINQVAGQLYEIDVSRVDTVRLQQYVQALHKRHQAAKGMLKEAAFAGEAELLRDVFDSIHHTLMSVLRVVRYVEKVNELIPIVKAVLQLRDEASDHGVIVLEISEALRANTTEPNLEKLKKLLLRHQLKGFDAKLQFEHLNDVSDKLIGLLNDKLLLVISVSETLVEGLDYDGANDVCAEQRLPDELCVLFVTSAVLEVLFKLEQCYAALRDAFSSLRLYLQIMDSGVLAEGTEKVFQSGKPSIHEMVVGVARVLQGFKGSFEGFHAALGHLGLPVLLNCAYELIYEKAHRTWENPFRQKKL